MELKDLAQVGCLDTVNGKVFSNLCIRSVCSSRELPVAEAIAKQVQQVKVVDNSPTTPHSFVSVTLTATSWGHRRARRRPPMEVSVGPQRQEEHFDWIWAAEELLVDLELDPRPLRNPAQASF